MTNAVVLGAGMVGSVMAWDMRRMGYEVTVIDANEEALARTQALAEVQVVRTDLSDAATLTSAVAPFDVVVGALSSRMGFESLRAVIRARRSYVDISFMGEDARELDALAKEHGVTAVVDCGVGPGMSNMIAGWAAKHLSPCERIDILVGGLPAVRSWPYQYKAPFAATDVIEEYVRPARIVESGKVVVRPALSEPELVEFEGVGTLEAFNTDGLRSLAYTLDVPNLRERTMRYPGHIELMRVFRDSGFFSPEPLDFPGGRVSPLELTSRLLFPKWTLAPREEELTVMRVVAEGKEGGRSVRHTWTLLDRTDKKTGFRSMSRTTGFPATIMADVVATGAFREPGVHPPEVVGRIDGMLDTFLAALAERGVVFTHDIMDLTP